MSETLEKNIRVKAILIYIIVAIICGGMIIYIYRLRDDIDDQKKNIEQYHRELSYTNKLIRVVNTSQSEVNLYISAKRTKHYNRFKENILIVEQLIDSLKNINPSQNEKLQQINALLIKKGKVVANLNKQFGNKNPIESINDFLENVDPVIKRDTVLVTSTMQDTIIYPAQKKGFWKKLSGLFSSGKEADTITTIATSKLDTLTIPKSDTLQMVSEVSEIAEKAKEDYVQRIISIEKNLNSLVVSDQAISSEITTLLIELYSQTVQKRLDEIQQSEQLIRQNNTYSIVSSIVSLILIFIFILLIISDVNKGYKLRKNIEQANTKIKQLMESRHKLLLSVSHDIKTPLNSILGVLELKETEKELQSQEIRIIKDSGKHILSLLNNLLEFSSIEQGRSNISSRSFNLYDLCNETVEMFIPLARKKNLALLYSFDINRALEINSDPLKIKQILINILSNSVKYTIEGSIRFEVKYSNNKLYCNIQDSGVGFTKDQSDNIFKAFSRVEENSHLSEGSGLGLFVVKGLVDLLEGNIKVTSQQGKGTSTEIIIPAQESLIKKEFQPINILVIDDDIPYLTIICNMLSKLGHTTDSCNNIKDFEAIIPFINKYDNVITDMEMVQFTGIDVLRDILQSGTDIPVTIITAREDISEQELKRIGFSSYLKKPVSIDDLKHLFGGKDKLPLNYDNLYSLLSDDKNALHEVLISFIDSTTENIEKLRNAVFNGNFEMAQFAGHKMLTMFKQIGATDKIDILTKIDSIRFQRIKSYAHWEDDVLEVIEYAEQIISQVKMYLKTN